VVNMHPGILKLHTNFGGSASMVDVSDSLMSWGVSNMMRRTFKATVLHVSKLDVCGRWRDYEKP
jgi:hypothetical protein